MKSTEKKRNLIYWDLSFLDGRIYDINEIKANRTVAFTMFTTDLLLLVALLLNYLGIFQIRESAVPFLVMAGIEFLLPSVWCFIRQGHGRAMKYLLIVGFLLGVTAAFVVENAIVLLLMLVPLILSCRYYSKRFVTITAILTSVFGVLGSVCGVIYGSLDLNAVVLENPLHMIDTDLTMTIFREVEKGELIKMMLQYSALPDLLMTAVICFICIQSAARGRALIDEEVAVTEKSSRIASELDLANSIQANMLPRIFPPFPDHVEFDIFASMQPAKEVGGDFYDFFMTDDTHVAIVIADVSGKGVPAALFMVTAKTLIKDHTQLGLEPAEVFTRVNKELCEGNEAGLFVTGWMGILDIRTGVMRYVNAGHNPPMLLQNGTYTYLRSRAGFVLAGMDTVKYRQNEITIQPGDRIFLYTDGVTEATSSAKELYGEDRLEAYLNAHTDDPIKDVVPGLRTDIDSFVGEAEQFDDITMLLLEYKSTGDSSVIEKEYKAKVKYLNDFLGFLEGEMEKAGVPMKAQTQISVAAEEIFVNVAHYAYPSRKGMVKILLSFKDNVMSLTFKDSGIPFNPLAKDDPDITASADDRAIGGLGIYMVKKTMDNVTYKYTDEMNVLTLEKKY